MKTTSIRNEERSDYGAIDGVIRTAFGRAQEADFVRMLRSTDGYVSKYSLVAVVDGVVSGHVMLSYIEIVGTEDVYKVLCLAPLSVSPAFQQQGIGTELVNAVLEVAKTNHELAVTVEGSPDYYSRFGFKPGLEHGVRFHLPHGIPKDSGRILSFADTCPIGEVVYPEAFKIVE